MDFNLFEFSLFPDDTFKKNRAKEIADERLKNAHLEEKTTTAE